APTSHICSPPTPPIEKRSERWRGGAGKFQFKPTVHEAARRAEAAKKKYPATKVAATIMRSHRDRVVPSRTRGLNPNRYKPASLPKTHSRIELLHVHPNGLHGCAPRGSTGKFATHG